MTPIGGGKPGEIVRGAIVVCNQAGCGKHFETRPAAFMSLDLTKRTCPECSARLRAEFQEQERATREKSKDYRRQEWLTSQIPPHFRGKTLENFDASDGRNVERVEIFRKYAGEFPVDRPPRGYPSLLITRDIPGVGKTHLACSILRAIIERHPDPASEGSPFQFWSAMSIKVKLDDSQRFSSAETQEQALNHFKSVRLLVIDDVGKEQMAERDLARLRELYFAIIDGRYLFNLPIILTANLAFEPWPGTNLSLVDLMGLATVSRLREMTGGIQYVIEGHDRR